MEYWKKLNSLGKRQMVALHVRGRTIKLSLALPEIGRAYAGEFEEIANEMRLVEVPAIRGKQYLHRSTGGTAAHGSATETS